MRSGDAGAGQTRSAQVRLTPARLAMLFVHPHFISAALGNEEYAQGIGRMNCLPWFEGFNLHSLVGRTKLILQLLHGNNLQRNSFQRFFMKYFPRNMVWNGCDRKQDSSLKDFQRKMLRTGCYRKHVFNIPSSRGRSWRWRSPISCSSLRP